MTKERLAAQLDGREHPFDLTKDEERLAKESGLLVVFGASDDLCKLRGAVHDEADVYDGGTIRIADGKLLDNPDRDEEEVLKKFGVLAEVKSTLHHALTIEALWCEEKGYSWTYRTEEDHATFEVMEDGEHCYCRGLVIDMREEDAR